MQLCPVLQDTRPLLHCISAAACALHCPTDSDPASFISWKTPCSLTLLLGQTNFVFRRLDIPASVKWGSSFRILSPSTATKSRNEAQVLINEPLLDTFCEIGRWTFQWWYCIWHTILNDHPILCCCVTPCWKQTHSQSLYRGEMRSNINQDLSWLSGEHLTG